MQASSSQPEPEEEKDNILFKWAVGILGTLVLITILIFGGLWFRNKFAHAEIPAATQAPAATEAPAIAAPATKAPAKPAPAKASSVMPVDGADLREYANNDAKITFKKVKGPFELLGKDLGPLDDSSDNWLYVKDSAGTGWIPQMAIVGGDKLDISKVPAKDGKMPAKAPAAAPAVATQPPAVAESPVAPAATDVTVDYKVPTNAGRLWTEKTGVLGFYFDCNINKPCEVTYPAQSTLILALGEGIVTDGKYSHVMATDGTIGNIYTNVCELTTGSCKATVTAFSAGNVRITIVFAPFEVPAETLAGALNRMSAAPNCGGSGCLVINAYSKNGKEITLKRGDKVQASQLTGLLVNPTAPYVKVNLVYGFTPSGAEPIIDGKIVVGSIYYLSESDAFVNVPEGGGTIFYCGANAEIDGTCKAGTALVLTGNKSDGSTPADLNRTVKIVTNEPTMIRVYMVYGTDFDQFVKSLQAAHPDWNWK